MTGGWRKVHEELRNFQSSPSIVVVIRWRSAGHVERMGMMIIVYTFLVAKPEGKSSLGRPSSRYQDNIKVVFKEIGSESVDCICLSQVRDRCQAVLNIIMNLLSFKKLNFLRRTLTSWNWSVINYLVWCQKQYSNERHHKLIGDQLSA